jgi:hypothetical protein
MWPPYKPLIPTDVGDVRALLGTMLVKSPLFLDTSGYFPEKNIDTTFYSLNEGLQVIRPIIGESLYLKLREMSDRMRAHFEADPEDKTDDSLKGRDIIEEMLDLLKPHVSKYPPDDLA